MRRRPTVLQFDREKEEREDDGWSCCVDRLLLCEDHPGTRSQKSTCELMVGLLRQEYNPSESEDDERFDE
ncbi:hypothetical protein CEXT_75481, partial [Caerostris extrusa]